MESALSSRLIVKNLPARITKEKLQETFCSKGDVTDVSLKYTQDGRFRGFAFVGYRTTEQAAEAKQFFDGTYLGALKLGVDYCRAFNDADKPRAWSKYSEDSSAFKRLLLKRVRSDAEKAPPATDGASQRTNATPVDAEFHKLTGDADFQEYLVARGAKGSLKKQAYAWSNDLVDAHGTPTEHTSATDLTEPKEKKRKSAKLAETATVANAQAAERTENVDQAPMAAKKRRKLSKKPKNSNGGAKFYVSIKGQLAGTSAKQVKEFFKPLAVCCVKFQHASVDRRVSKRAPAADAIVVGMATESDMEQALRRNKSFLGAKKVSVRRLAAEATEALQRRDVLAERSVVWEAKNKQLLAELRDEGIADSGRLFVRNLAYGCTEADLEQLFNQFGPLAEVSLPVDPSTQLIKGFAFVTFVMPEHAVKAYVAQDGAVFQGRMLHILPARPKQELSLSEMPDWMPFKKKKQLQQQLSARQSHTWNALFLGANAVADVMSEQLATSKAAFLNAHDAKDSLGVRLALAETQLVTETRRFLEQNGVALDAFGRPDAKRSDRVLLVKNLPAHAEPAKLEQMFAEHGLVLRVVLPPSGVTALVEMANAFEAAKAFKKLAYRPFDGCVMYLEWAPVKVFARPADGDSSSAGDAVSQPAADAAGAVKEPAKKPRKKLPLQAEPVEEPSPETHNTEPPVAFVEDRFGDKAAVPAPAAPASRCSVFVKNLNFDTDESSLRRHFQTVAAEHVLSVSVARKRAPKTGTLLSLGYGFVEFNTKDAAADAIKRLQSSCLDGHDLQLKLSHRVENANTAGVRKSQKSVAPTGSKILIRNVPFESTEKEISELFGVFGQLRSVRMPRKLAASGGSRQRHRGFGFVDFVSGDAARRAFDALSPSTHLLGRRLVLEWANPDDSVDAIRDRTALRFQHGATLRKPLKKQQLVADILGVGTSEL